MLASSFSEAGRRAEVGETARLYACAAYSLLQSSQPGPALVMLERGKTRLLAEALALGDADLKMLPQKLQEQVREARQTVHSLEAEMRLPLATPARRDDRTLADLLRQARTELNSRVEEIRKDHPDFMPSGLELPGILALIPEGGALVAPLATSQGSAMFVVPHGAQDVTEEHVIRLEDYKEETLSELLRGAADDPRWGGWMGGYFAFRRSSTRQTLDEWQVAIERFSGEIWDTLLSPVHARLQELKVKQVILMPSGGLQLLPLHAAWREVDGDKRAFLDDYEVVHAPSAYVLEVSRHRASERKDKTVLAMGINTYADPGVNPLFNATSEAEVVADLLKVEPLLDATATKQAIQQNVPSAATLHLSCHGYFAWGDPMASGPILHDGRLTLAEIIGTLNLEACRLVTLSACETGITDVSQSPDEYIGLPAGFMQAGAPAVVSSLWTVDDRSTALLMERFYRNHLEKGMSYPAALREAQLWLRDEKGYARPFYWAAFTFSGAW